MIRSARAGGTPAWTCTVFHSPACAAGFALLACAIGSNAHAAPPENADPALTHWFQSLQAPNGTSCCSIADCRTTQTRPRGDRTQALIDGRWVDVPPRKILDRMDNPTGKAVVCSTNGAEGPRILCFVRVTEV